MSAKTYENKVTLRENSVHDPTAVIWTKKYNSQLEAVWKTLPGFVAKFIATVAILLLCTTLKGDWISILVHIKKQFGVVDEVAASFNQNSNFSWSEITLESLKLNNFSYFLIGSSAVSYVMYYGVGGFLHWYFYIRQRDKAEEWKCQPNTWLSPEMERQAILEGTSSLLVNTVISAILSCYAYNGGYNTLYYDIFEYPLWWFFLQIPVVFIYHEYTLYLLHRMYHTPWFYKRFHKMHHQYKQPIVFTVTAVHPIESAHLQLTVLLPMYVLPVHWFLFYAVIIYEYYHGILEHSGIDLKAYWWQPWQPDTIFHDNHHQYFHVNFGFNMDIWDKLHGTMRRKDRLYREDVFFGQGKPLSEATQEEIQEDMIERLSENPLAFREKKRLYALDEAELEEIVRSKVNSKKIN